MAIYTPEEAAALGPATNFEEAAAKGAFNFVCRAAPALAAYGALTGNLPAFAFGTGGTVACGLPFIEIPDAPPVTEPIPGGTCPVFYRVRVRAKLGTLCSGSGGSIVEEQRNLQGPLQFSFPFFGNGNNQCKPGQQFEIRNWRLFNAGMTTGFSFLLVEEFGDWASVVEVSPLTPEPVGGCGPAPPVQTPYPPSFPAPPPGYPDKPQLPGGGGTVPYKNPRSPADRPPDRIPWTIPPIPLPPVIVPVIKPTINAPITIPVSFPISISPNINVTIPVQLGPSGEIRTPPDLICPCEYGEGDGPAVDCPETVLLDLPYYECGEDGGFKTATIAAVSNSVPPLLIDKLLSSSNLAEVGCESLAPEQAEPSLISSGRSGSVIVEPQYSDLLSDQVVSVELRLSGYSLGEYRELTTFPGAGQRKFGSISYCLADSEGGSDQVYLWDDRTYYRLPDRLKAARIKVLLRPGISWELWDTGERK